MLYLMHIFQRLLNVNQQLLVLLPLMQCQLGRRVGVLIVHLRPKASGKGMPKKTQIPTRCFTWVCVDGEGIWGFLAFPNNTYLADQWRHKLKRGGEIAVWPRETKKKPSFKFKVCVLICVVRSLLYYLWRHKIIILNTWLYNYYYNNCKTSSEYKSNTGVQKIKCK